MGRQSWGYQQYDGTTAARKVGKKKKKKMVKIPKANCKYWCGRIASPAWP